MAEVVIDSEETLRAAEARYEAIIAEVQGIQGQLGVQFSAKEYWGQRSVALAAMRAMLQEQRMLKGAIKEYNRIVHERRIEGAVDLSDPVHLAKAARQLFVRLLGDGVDLDRHEMDVVDALGLYVKRNTKAEVRKGGA